VDHILLAAKTRETVLLRKEVCGGTGRIQKEERTRKKYISPLGLLELKGQSHKVGGRRNNA
jgi:hypothetical protein